MTNLTTPTTGLASAFLALAENKDFIKDHIEGLGDIGIKRFSLADRDAWLSAEKDSSAVLIQATICDPLTGELSLKNLSIEQIKAIPAPVADELVKKIYKHNGVKTVKELEAEKQNGEGSEQLKNSEADQI